VLNTKVILWVLLTLPNLVIAFDSNSVNVEVQAEVHSSMQMQWDRLSLKDERYQQAKSRLRLDDSWMILPYGLHVELQTNDKNRNVFLHVDNLVSTNKIDKIQVDSIYISHNGKNPVSAENDLLILNPQDRGLLKTHVLLFIVKIQPHHKPGQYLANFTMKILLFILFLPLSAYAGMMSFSVSPGIVKFETVQGSVKSFDLNFINQGDNLLKVDVQVMDLKLDANGVPVISKMSKKNGQWGRFVKLDKNSFKLSGKQSKKINVTLKTPRGGYGGGYFAVVFNTSAAKSKNGNKKSKNSMTIGGQIPALFIGEISRMGTRKMQVLKGAINKAPYTEDNPFKFRFLLKNNGTTHANVVGDVLIRHNKKVVGRVRLESGSGLVFPNGERYFVATWDKFAKYANKKLQAEARFSYSGGRATKKMRFIIK